MKNTIPVSILLSLSLFAIPSQIFAARLIGLKTEYFNSTNRRFEKIYGSGAVFGIGARSERGSSFMWGLEIEYSSRTGEPLDWPDKNSMKGLLVKGPDLSDKTGVDWNTDKTSTRLTVVSFLSTAAWKLLGGSPISPTLALKLGFTGAKEKFSGEYEHDTSAGWVKFKDDASAFGTLMGAVAGIELFRGPFRLFLYGGYNYVPSWSNLGYQDLGGFTAGAQILFTLHLY